MREQDQQCGTLYYIRHKEALLEDLGFHKFCQFKVNFFDHEMKRE